MSTSVAVGAIAGLALTASFAMAQSNATSTVEVKSMTEAGEAAASSTSPEVAAPDTQAPIAPQPALMLVRSAGTRYIDYCTDGTKTIQVPSDPEIAVNLNKPDARTPTCPDGMKWDHTSGMDAYDTPTGDLEIGKYAQLADGTYLVHLPASTYTDATSTAVWPDRIVRVQEDPAVSASQTDTTPPADAAQMNTVTPDALPAATENSGSTSVSTTTP